VIDDADCAVLSAIDEDSLCVPRLLTDYILKGELITCCLVNTI